MQPVLHLSDLDLTKQYSYADYLLWQFQERVELIKGFIMKMSPAPNMNHQTIALNLSGIFYQKFKAHSCRVFSAPFDVRLPIKSQKKDTTVVQPDLCVICDESKLDFAGCNGTPDLMIEILSPNNTKHDLHTKFNLYEEAGVLEYWIVNPIEKFLLVYTLKEGKFIGLRPQSEDEIINSPLFPDLGISLIDVFDRV